MNGNADGIWQQTLDLIKADISDLSFQTWISPLKLIALDDNSVYLESKDEFIRSTVEQKHKSMIENALFIVTGRKYNLVISLEGTTKIVKSLSSSSDNLKYSVLNPKYTFDTFVVGNGNRFAHAACVAVAENPAHAYNPLFLYSPAGLGKTHLMHAIGHHILENNPASKVMYISSEKFTNELINAISSKTMEKFKDKYRNVDVLLIDDIQFIQNKESTQLEFFHTFNTLYDAGKQIIITSDKPPKGLISLEERLVSRFEWGLITEIEVPDLETRIAILAKKALNEGYSIDSDTLEYIASKFESNIRELEGALNKVIAYSTLTQTSITKSLAQEALRNVVSSKTKTITIKTIQEAVARYYNIKASDFLSAKKNREIAYPRQIAMFLCRELTDASLPKLGTEFGNRNHTTVIYAYDKIKGDRETKPEIDKVIEEITKIIIGE